MFEFDYYKQFGEFWQPRQNPFAFEDYELILPGSEIPKWFNHQSVGNSISFWVNRDCDYLQFVYCVVFEPNEGNATVQVSLKFNGIKFINLIPYRFKRITDMTCNHVWFLKLYESPIDSKDLNQFERNRVEVEFGAAVSHILRCGVHAECICPLVQDLSTDTLPPTPIPAFPICSISIEDLS